MQPRVRARDAAHGGAEFDGSNQERSNGWRQEGAGRVGPAGSGCVRARIRILRGAGQLRGGNGGGGRGEKGGRGDEERIFYFSLFVVDVERNKQSSSGGRENI